jgi:hypothetical protein
MPSSTAREMKGKLDSSIILSQGTILLIIDYVRSVGTDVTNKPDYTHILTIRKNRFPQGLCRVLWLTEFPTAKGSLLRYKIFKDYAYAPNPLQGSWMFEIKWTGEANSDS